MNLFEINSLTVFSSNQDGIYKEKESVTSGKTSVVLSYHRIFQHLD